MNQERLEICNFKEKLQNDCMDKKNEIESLKMEINRINDDWAIKEQKLQLSINEKNDEVKR